MNDEIKPSKVRARSIRAVRAKEKDKRKKHDPYGPKQKPDTPLYVVCPQCGGTGPTFTEGVGYKMCVCKRGFLETGYTEERYQKLVRQNDKLLVGLDEALRELSPSIRLSVLLAHGFKEADVDAAKSRL